MMKEIVEVVIEQGSGFGCVEESYTEMVTVTQKSIRYKCRPGVECEINIPREWSYQTNNPVFKNLFQRLSETVEKIINIERIEGCCDVGALSFQIKYADKTKKSCEFFLPSSDFKECFMILQQMVPPCEYCPAMMLTPEQTDSCFNWLGRRNSAGSW